MIYSFFPIIAYISVYTAWIFGRYSNVWSPTYIFYFAMTFSLWFGGISTKIILAYLTRASFPGFSMLMIPPAVGALLANLDAK